MRDRPLARKMSVDRLPFAGHTALVTGGARRIGRTIALRLAQMGCDLVIHHRDSAREAGKLCNEIRKGGIQAFAIQGDLADANVRAGLVAEARDAAGRPLSFLVNNASAFPPANLANLDWRGLASTLQVNAWAPYELTRSFAAQAREGAVVNLVDSRLDDPDWDRIGYHLSKRLLADLTLLSAREFAPRITVNGVGPGPVLAPVDAPEGTPGPTGRKLPMKRAPSPDDIADAVLYLLGSRSTTGVILPVDGGGHLGPSPTH